MPKPTNPLDSLSRQELLWLAGILKDACRERLEKNLVSQEFEERLYQRGPVSGRLDPRPFLKIWEPRYRKFLAAAAELQALLESEGAQEAAESLRARFEPAQKKGKGRAKAEPAVEQPQLRFGPQSAQGIIEFQTAGRKGRTR